MKIVHFNNFNVIKIHKLVSIHLGKSYLEKLENGFVFIDNKNKIFGYCILKNDNKNIIIDWIWTKKGFGTDFLYRIEKSLFKKYTQINLNISIDPNEKKETVMRRINFYIKNNYREIDIIYRKKNGTLLKMFKIKKN